MDFIYLATCNYIMIFYFKIELNLHFFDHIYPSLEDHIYNSTILLSHSVTDVEI